ncbi:MAG: sugar ABC transporter substrate-binding protein [Planctomycetes bacterium]|nr:sugar ABC transporter substrate-binding protein [Planctomycetota bacterium]NOG54487.1 substrate-binding domain-containing protein [Planctomycetota bacterium]
MKLQTIVAWSLLSLCLVWNTACKQTNQPSGESDSSTDSNAATPQMQQEPASKDEAGDGDTARTTIAVIPKGTTHVFWNAVKHGAMAAGQEADVSIFWKGPVKENARAEQIQVVQQFIAQHVDGIVLAPLDYRALVAPVTAAKEAGIPVVIIDSALAGEPGTDFVSFIATNNLTGGLLAGEMMTDLLAGEGKVVVMRYIEGSASTSDRERGYLDAIAASTGIEVLSENQYAGPTAGEAQNSALNMMSLIRQADGIFCPNESSTYGMLLALRQEGLAGQVHFIGFDASPPLVEGLRLGDIDALIVQDPQAMGYLGVNAMVSHLAGEKVPAMQDTGVVLVRRENMDDPDIQRLLQ